MNEMRCYGNGVLGFTARMRGPLFMCGVVVGPWIRYASDGELYLFGIT
jgi:hypothetical protein